MIYVIASKYDILIMLRRTQEEVMCMSIEPWMIWILVILVMTVVEIMTVGFFAFIIALGGVIALITTFFTDILWVQASVFLISSIGFFFTVKPFTNKLFPPKEAVRTGAARMIGQTGVVIVDIDNKLNEGQIRASGEVWSARSADACVRIEKDTIIKIININGVHAIVNKKT